MTEIQTFDPVLYSIAENQFLFTSLGKPTIVALRELPNGVNVNAIRPILDRVNELQELEKHEGFKWVGVKAMQDKIATYLQMNAKWALDHKRNPKAPRYPSLFSYDARGKAHRGGPGSDADRVRTYFTPTGERIPFELQLIPDNVAPWSPPGFTEAPMAAGLKVDQNANRIECLVPVGDGVCGHTESYKPDSRASYNAARARMSKHLRSARDAKELHLELHTEEFRS